MSVAKNLPQTSCKPADLWRSGGWWEFGIPEEEGCRKRGSVLHWSEDDVKDISHDACIHVSLQDAEEEKQEVARQS